MSLSRGLALSCHSYNAVVKVCRGPSKIEIMGARCRAPIRNIVFANPKFGTLSVSTEGIFKTFNVTDAKQKPKPAVSTDIKFKNQSSPVLLPLELSTQILDRVNSTPNRSSKIESTDFANLRQRERFNAHTMRLKWMTG